MFKLFPKKSVKPVISRTVFLYAQEPHCYTRFNTLQPLSYTCFCIPGLVILSHRPVALRLSSYPLHFRLLTLETTSSDLFSQVMNTATYDTYRYQCTCSNARIYSPAYINNVMEEYKATIHSQAGQNENLIVQKGLITFNI